jgi:FkbM family methyltransferase
MIDKHLGGHGMQHIDRDYIQWAYRLFLDREVSPEIIQNADAKVLSSTIALRQHFMASTEFQIKNKHFLMRLLNPKDKRAIVNGPGGYRIFVNLGDLYVSWGIIFGNYESTEAGFITRNLPKGGCLLDVGANIGFYSLLARSVVGESGSVHAFEPRSRAFHMLEESIKENGFHNVYAHNVALGAQDGTAELAFAKDEFNLGGSQLSTGQELNANLVETESISVKALDEFELRTPMINMIKIDIEGAEPLFFEGARRTIAMFKPKIISEINGPHLQSVSRMSVADFVRLVVGMGYSAHLLNMDSTISTALDVDTIAEASVEAPILNAVFLPR